MQPGVGPSGPWGRPAWPTGVVVLCLGWETFSALPRPHPRDPCHISAQTWSLWPKHRLIKAQLGSTRTHDGNQSNRRSPETCWPLGHGAAVDEETDEDDGQAWQEWARQETVFKTLAPAMPETDTDGPTAGAGLTGAVACSQSLAWAWHTVGPWEAFTKVLAFSVQGT